MNITNKPLRLPASKRQPSTTIMTITPAIAQELLEHNTANRLVRASHVKWLVSIIRDGKWKVTHQGIAVDENGVLLDGQHRLMAIALSGQAVECMVTSGLDHSAKDAVDTHQRRTMNDIVMLHSDPQVNKAVCRIIRTFTILTRSDAREAGLDRSVDHYREVYSKYGSALAWAGIQSKGNKRVFGRGDVGAAMFQYHHMHPARAEEFMEQFVSGENLERNSPILQAREMFLSGAIRIGTHVGEYFWKLIRAQQAHYSGEGPARLFQASEDWLGNENAGVVKERASKGEKAAATRRMLAQR